MQKLL